MANLKYIRGLSGRGFRVKNNTGAWATCKEGVNVQVDLDDVGTQDILSRERDNFVRVAGSGSTTAILKPLTRRGLRITPASSTVTITEANPGVVTFTAHGLKAGDAITLSTTGVLPTNLAANTVYYVLAASLTVNTFRLGLTPGGSAINTTGAVQSGVHTGSPVKKNVTQDSDVTVSLNDGEIKRFLKRNFGRYIVIDTAADTVQDLYGITDKQASFRVEDPTLTFIFAGANNDVTFVPKTSDGEIVTVAFTDPGTNQTPINVIATGTDIVVELDITQNVFASAILSDGAAVPSDGDTVTINDVTYRLKGTMAQANDVKLEAGSDATLDHLVNAVNQTGVAGTDYFAGTVAPTGVTAGARSGTAPNATVTFTATVAGTAGNAFPKSETSTNLSWDAGGGGTTFSGGVDEVVRSTAANVKTAIEADTPGANELVTVSFEGTGAGLVAPVAATALGADPEGLDRGEAVNAVDLTDSFNIGQLRRRFKAWVEN